MEKKWGHAIKVLFSINRMGQKFTEEVENLVGLGREESPEISEVRYFYADIMQKLCNMRDSVGRSEAGRNFAIAITELENSCIRAVKGMYSK